MEQDTAAGGKNIEDQQRPQLQLCHAMPCKEATYLTRTVMYALTPPDTPAKRGKLTTVTGRAPDVPARRGKLTRVAGRVLPALQLHSEGN